MERMIIKNDKYLVALRGEKVWIKNILPSVVAPFGFSEEEYDELIKRGCTFIKYECLGNNPSLSGLWVSDFEKVDTSGKDAYEEYPNIKHVLDKIDIAKMHVNNRSKKTVSEPTNHEKKGTIDKYYEDAVSACRRATKFQNSPARWFAPDEAITREQENLNNIVNRFLEALKKEDISIQIDYINKILDDDTIHEGMEIESLSIVVNNILREVTAEPIDEILQQQMNEEIEAFLSVLRRVKNASEGPARWFAPEGAVDNMQAEYDNSLSSLRDKVAMLTIGQLKTLFESSKQSNEYLLEVIQMAIIDQFSSMGTIKDNKTL